MERDLLRLLQACVGILVALVTVIAVFALFPKISSDSGPAWIQAIGSIGAIWAAIAVVRMQARESSRLAEKAHIRQTFSTLRAMETEIRTHLETVKVATQRILEAEVQGRISQFPAFVPRFYIYESAATILGQVDDQALVSEIIASYAEIGLFFDAMSRRTECARQLPGTQKELGQPMTAELADIYGEFLALTKSAKGKCQRIQEWHGNICQRLKSLDASYAQKLRKMYKLDAHRNS